MLKQNKTQKQLPLVSHIQNLQKCNIHVASLKESDSNKCHICIQKQMQFYIKDRKKSKVNHCHTQLVSIAKENYIYNIFIFTYKLQPKKL